MLTDTDNFSFLLLTSIKPFSQHNFRLYGRHVKFWNHLRSKVLHPIITQTHSGKVTKAFF